MGGSLRIDRASSRSLPLRIALGATAEPDGLGDGDTGRARTEIEGCYASRQGGRKQGSAGMLVVMIPKEGGIAEASPAGVYGWHLQQAGSSFETEVIALEKAVGVIEELCQQMSRM